MRDWWPNYVLPAVLAVVIARITYVTFAQGRVSVLIVFGAVIGGLPVLFYLAVHGVGFLYGLLGRRPSTHTAWFEVGWNAGLKRAGHSET